MTEQYPKGIPAHEKQGSYNITFYSIALGHTVSEIDITRAKGVFDKTVFSMIIPDVETILDGDKNRKSVVLFGIEVIK